LDIRSVNIKGSAGVLGGLIRNDVFRLLDDGLNRLVDGFEFDVSFQGIDMPFVDAIHQVGGEKCDVSLADITPGYRYEFHN
jgi:hypothetical protein